MIEVVTAGLLFDMDGVLISSIGSVLRSWRVWGAEYGVPGAETLEIPHGTRAVDVMKQLVPGVDTVRGLRRIEDLEIADTGDLQTLPGVKVLLESLPVERWAIVTSATRRLLEARLAAAELPVPVRLVSADDVVKGKPDPEPYRKGAELIGSDPADCVVVEDAPSGVGAGKAAGCRVLGVLGTHSEEELREAGVDWVARSLEDLVVVEVDGKLRLRFEGI